MAISREDVERVARLARLRLGDEELPRLADELSRIVDYVQELREVDTSSVEADVVDALPAPLRDDVPCPGLTHEAALAAAPRTVDDAFAVPAFVDES
ncbi:MAG: Asp-tRNA(Asn)/Glu-tRNA(Gln) amidotransferase subunit GatC [Myxococcales bacterium]|nr:Asp-tRNA(Asn)/Glu-tRNA(Gln) amidotransferase subunit GatC [Myxococcales bacterium]